MGLWWWTPGFDQWNLGIGRGNWGFRRYSRGFEQWNRGSGGESLAPAMGPGNRAVGPGAQ